MGDELNIGGEQIDWLDQKLRDEAAYIDDAGFTAAVVQKLPMRRATRSIRSAILLSAAVLASLLAYFLSGGGRFVFEALAQASLFSPTTILIAAVLLGLSFSAAGAFFAAKRASVAGS